MIKSIWSGSVGADPEEYLGHATTDGVFSEVWEPICNYPMDTTEVVGHIPNTYTWKASISVYLTEVAVSRISLITQ